MQSRIFLAVGLLLASLSIQAAVDVQWRTASFGTGIGKTGIWPVDADHDGDLDFVVGGGRGFGLNSKWSIVSFNTDAGRYEIAWQSAPGLYPFPLYGDSIQALRVVADGGTQRVWIGRVNGSVEVVDLATRQVLQTLQPTLHAITDFAAADIDNDGALDVAVVTDHETFLYDPQTLTLERTLAYGGQRVAVGNIDDDVEFELVYSSGAVLEVDSGGYTEEWVSSIPFGARVELADIDSDGRDEIVGADGWYLIRAWDAEMRSLKWDIPTSHDITALRLIDVTGDGTPEILYGDGQFGYIHAIDAATQDQLWAIQNPKSGVTDIAVFDADNDGALELLWGAGHQSTEADGFYVHDVSSRALEWRSESSSGPFTAVDIGDIDADGELEMVVASQWDSIDGGISAISVYDAATNELEWSSVGQAYFGGRALKLLNVDADPQLEIVLGTQDYNELLVIDGLTHEVQAEGRYNSGTYLTAMDAADLTGDGIPELIAGNTASNGSALFVIDPASGALLWQSSVLTPGYSQVTDVLATDVGAPGPDIIGVSYQVHVIRWSDRRHIYSAGSTYRAVTAADVASSAGVEILAGTTTGTLDVLDGETLDVLATHNVCSNAITALEMVASNRVLLTCNDELMIYDLASQSVVESKPAGVGLLGSSGSLVRKSSGGRAIILVGGAEAVKFVDNSSNNAPLLTATPVSVHWRTTTEVQLSASDADNDPLQFEMVRQSTRGTSLWLDRTSGRLRYSPDAAMGLGTDAVQIRVSDGYSYSETQTLQITVTNTVPNATAARHDLSPGTTTISGTFSATDADGDPLTYSIVRQPTLGTVTFNPTTGTFQYVGTGSASQTDSVTFAVSDGVSQVESTVEFRYVAPSTSGNGGGSGGGGGGAFGALLPALLALLVRLRRRAHRARLPRAAPEANAAL